LFLPPFVDLDRFCPPCECGWLFSCDARFRNQSDGLSVAIYFVVGSVLFRSQDRPFPKSSPPHFFFLPVFLSGVRIPFAYISLFSLFEYPLDGFWNAPRYFSFCPHDGFSLFLFQRSGPKTQTFVLQPNSFLSCDPPKLHPLVFFPAFFLPEKNHPTFRCAFTWPRTFSPPPPSRPWFLFPPPPFGGCRTCGHRARTPFSPQNICPPLTLAVPSLERQFRALSARGFFVCANLFLYPPFFFFQTSVSAVRNTPRVPPPSGPERDPNFLFLFSPVPPQRFNSRAGWCAVQVFCEARPLPTRAAFSVPKSIVPSPSPPNCIKMTTYFSFLITRRHGFSFFFTSFPWEKAWAPDSITLPGFQGPVNPKHRACPFSYLSVLPRPGHVSSLDQVTFYSPPAPRPTPLRSLPLSSWFFFR